MQIPGTGMTSKSRGIFLIVGGVIGGLGLLIPGLYGVSFDPPANTTYANVDLTKLGGFSSAPVIGQDSAVYNAFGGPVNFAATQVAVLVMLAVGILVVALKIDVEAAERTAQKAGNVLGYIVHGHIVVKLSAIGSAAVVIANFIWGFRFNRTPPAITQAFVADLGGGKSATTAAQYLSGSLGLGALILFFGLLLGFAGAFPRIGCSVLLLLVAAFIVLLLFAH